MSDEVRWEEQPFLRNPAALIAFQGWGDAGSASSMALDYLLDGLAGYRFASIDPDDYFDFQVARPIVEFDEEGVRSLDWPDTDFHAVTLPDRDLVIVTGVEPHNRWKAFCGRVSAVLKEVGVSEVVALGAFIGQVPHTLPVPLVGSSTEPGAIERHQLFASEYEGPTGIIGALTDTLARDGFHTLSVWAAVPHYISSQEYPPGALALLDKALEIVEVRVDVSELQQAALEFRDDVDQAMNDPEMQSYVAELESQALTEETGSDDPGEQLLDEIEKFLRGG